MWQRILLWTEINQFAWVYPVESMYARTRLLQHAMHIVCNLFSYWFVCWFTFDLIFQCESQSAATWYCSRNMCSCCTEILRSVSLNSYGMFQPKGPNFLLSWIRAWKKHSPYRSFLKTAWEVNKHRWKASFKTNISVYLVLQQRKQSRHVICTAGNQGKHSNMQGNLLAC